MAKLDFREIVDNSELELFLLRFMDYVGVKLPSQYVSRGTVVGVYLQNRLVGGYMLISTPPFRSLLFVPDSVKESNPRISAISSDALEINGLWISASLRSPDLQLAVWFHLVSKIFLSKKKYVLLLRNSHNRTMERLLGLAKPELIYEGAPMLMAGEVTHGRIQVSITSRWKILLFSYKYWYELKDRRKRAMKVLLRPQTISDLSGASILEPLK